MDHFLVVIDHGIFSTLFKRNGGGFQWENELSTMPEAIENIGTILQSMWETAEPAQMGVSLKQKNKHCEKKLKNQKTLN